MNRLLITLIILLIISINPVNAVQIEETYLDEKFPLTLEKYYPLTFKEFLSELKKKNRDITSIEVQELLQKQYLTCTENVQLLILEIQETGQEIDPMIYELYIF